MRWLQTFVLLDQNPESLLLRNWGRLLLVSSLRCVAIAALRLRTNTLELPNPLKRRGCRVILIAIGMMLSLGILRMRIIRFGVGISLSAQIVRNQLCVALFPNIRRGVEVHRELTQLEELCLLLWVSSELGSRHFNRDENQ